MFTEAGAPADRPRTARDRPLLAMDVGGPGWEGAVYSPDDQTLFVAAPLCPPVGDQIPLAFRIPGAERPVAARAIVLDARAPDAAGPGSRRGMPWASGRRPRSSTRRSRSTRHRATGERLGRRRGST